MAANPKDVFNAAQMGNEIAPPTTDDTVKTTPGAPHASGGQFPTGCEACCCVVMTNKEINKNEMGMRFI
jgi:hypothetical protein